jgi:hypothetical protein
MQLIALGSVFLTLVALLSLTACCAAAVLLSYWRACPRWVVISLAAPSLIVCGPLYILSLLTDDIPLFLKIVFAVNSAAAVFCGMQIWKRARSKEEARPNQSATDQRP